MPPEEHKGMDEAIDRFWDQVTQGQSSVTGGLDLADGAAILHLHAFDDRPGPNPAFRKRLREELMRAQAIPVSSDASPPFLLNSHAGQVRQDIPPPRPRAVGRRGWVIAQLATAALLLVTLGLGYLAFGPGRPRTEQTSDNPAVVAPATPAATPEAATPLMSTTLPEGMVPAEIIGGLNVYTITPGNAAQWNPKDISATCCTGPRLNYLLAGTYTLRSEGPVQILRGGGPGSWEEVPAGTEVVLERGDALLSQMMDSFEAVNEGVEEVLLLDGVLFGGDASEDPVPEEQSGVPAWYAHYQDIFLTPRPVPAGPLTLRLQQATLAPGDVILEPPGAVVQLAVSLDESAVVGGTLLKPDAFDLRNLGEKAVDLYVMTLESVAAAAATPAPGEADTESLATVVLPAGAIPDQVGGSLNHFTIPPGTASTWDASQVSPSCCRGPRLNYLLTGSLTVRSNGPMLVLHADRAESPEEIPAATEIVLGPGDAVISRMEDIYEVTNDESAPVELLDAVFFDGVVSEDPVPSGWEFHDQDIMRARLSVPPGPSTLRLLASSVAAGATLELPAGALAQLVVTQQNDVSLGTQGEFGVKNIGAKPAAVYVLLLEPAGTGSDLLATGVPTP